MTAYSGGSDSTAPSFLKPHYVQYNSITKSRDLGLASDISAVLTGQVGAQSGGATLFFKITTPQPARIAIRRLPSSTLDRFVRVGLSDGGRKSLPLEPSGFASGGKLPAGTYYFTVASDRWQASPFTIAIALESAGLLQGTATGSIPSALTLQRRRVSGVASATALPSGNLRPAALIKSLAGTASGQGEAEITLGILRGIATGTAAASARLRQQHRLEGIASGTCLPVLTLRVLRFRGIATGNASALATMNVRRSSGYDY